MNTVTHLAPAAQVSWTVRSPAVRMTRRAPSWQEILISRLVHSPRHIARRLVLICLVTLTEADGQIHAHIDDIAELAGMKASSVRHILRLLRVDGDLVMVRRGAGRRPSIWRLTELPADA